MRSIVIAAVMALGLGLVGLQASSAAPMNGAAIHNAAHLNQGVEQAGWRWRRWHYWHWRHHHRHWW
jgi:hypothetical protein